MTQLLEVCRVFLAVQIIASLVLLRPLSAQEAATSRAMYGADRQQTRQAAEKKDDKALREALLKLHRDFPGRSSVREELAAVEARLGNDKVAMDWLQQAVAMGLVPKLDDPAFAALKTSESFSSIAARMDKNRQKISKSSSVFRFPSSDLLTEDIAYDAKAKRFLVSSVRQRKIISCEATGICHDFITAKDTAPQPLWAVLALRIDPTQRYLWATTESMVFESFHVKSEEGRCGLLKIELESRRIAGRFDCDGDTKHEMGDLTVASNGDVYVADGGSGDVFVLRKGAARLARLVPNGTFVAPQTPALSADEKLLYVPDYVAGTGAVRLSDGRVEWVKATVPAALDGIDGLYVHEGRFIAIQNGTAPERIVAFRLKTPLEVDGSEVIEANWADLGDPTHGVLVGNDFYFIANSGWDRVGRDGTITAGKPAEIRKMDLSKP